MRGIRWFGVAVDFEDRATARLPAQSRPSATTFDALRPEECDICCTTSCIASDVSLQWAISGPLRYGRIKALQVKDEQHNLQQSIDSGAIETFDDLQTWIWRRGWRIRVTERFCKQMRRIMIVNPGVTRGFQIKVPFEVGSSEFRQPGIWIYALLARSHSEKACYIGQSTSVMRRISEHAKRSRHGKGADALFRWSDQQETDVHVVLLELSRSAATKADTARHATVLEGTWLSAAVEASYQTPGVEKWGRLPRTSDQARSFREDAMWRAAKPIDEIVQCSPPLKQFWLGYI